MKKTLIIAPITVDYVNYVEVFPKGNETMSFGNGQIRIAGTGWNIASLHQKLEIPYHLIAVVGSGIYGDTIQQQAVKQEIPIYRSEEIQGCTYTMVDPTGAYRSMIVPGIEYTLPSEVLDELDLEEYDKLIYTGDCFEEYNDSLFYLFDTFEGTQYFIPGESGAVLDRELLAYLYSLHPHIFLHEDELKGLTDGIYEDVMQAAHLYYNKVQTPLFVQLQSKEILYLDQDDEVLIPNNQSSYQDTTGMLDGYVSGYLVGEKLGLTKQNQIRFGQFCADIIGHSANTFITDTEIEQCKQALGQYLING